MEGLGGEGPDETKVVQSRARAAARDQRRTRNHAGSRDAEGPGRADSQGPRNRRTTGLLTGRWVCWPPWQRRMRRLSRARRTAVCRPAPMASIGRGRRMRAIAKSGISALEFATRAEALVARFPNARVQHPRATAPAIRQPSDVDLAASPADRERSRIPRGSELHFDLSAQSRPSMSCLAGLALSHARLDEGGILTKYQWLKVGAG